MFDKRLDSHRAVVVVAYQLAVVDIHRKVVASWWDGLYNLEAS